VAEPRQQSRDRWRKECDKKPKFLSGRLKSDIEKADHSHSIWGGLALRNPFKSLPLLVSRLPNHLTIGLVNQIRISPEYNHHLHFRHPVWLGLLFQICSNHCLFLFLVFRITWLAALCQP
jgi:hypothetical protein